MSYSKSFLVIATLLVTAAAGAETIDLSDPRRAVALENDIRVDAQLASEFVSSRSVIRVTYQIHNLSSEAVAIADKMCVASYDRESRTITVSIGLEVPKNGEMPTLVTIGSGEKKIFTAGAMLSVPISFTAVPRLVQIRVNVLRDPIRFLRRAAVALTDQEFDQWLERNESIFLNTVPVRYQSREVNKLSDASQR